MLRTWLRRPGTFIPRGKRREGRTSEHPALPRGGISGTRMQDAEPKPPGGGERVAAGILAQEENTQIPGVGRLGSTSVTSF